MTAEQNRNEPFRSEASRRTVRDLDCADLECGDGVPTLVLVGQEPLGDRAGAKAQTSGITARTFALAATVLGQLLIGLAVAAGGSALVGLFAAITLLGCGLSLILVDLVNRR